MREQLIKNTILPLVVILLTAVCAGRAAESGDLAGENDELKQRIEQLDRELAEIKEALGGQAADSSGSKKSIWSSLDIQLYGYLKLDASYDTSRTAVGNFATWVEREDLNNDDDQFNMTANQSRFGVMITGPQSGDIKASGRAEVDFYGGGNAENRPRPMMRHAYMKLDWPDSRFSLIAGQTWDVISPLLPTTVNYSVAWFSGNIGYRRPQIRLTKEVDMDNGQALKLEGAVTRTIGRDDAVVDGTESGEDSGLPTLQGRISTKVDIFDVAPSAIGVSGHYGKEEYDTTPTGSSEDFRSWSLNVDFVQPVNDWLSIKSELFTGENLSAYLGGIGQGVTIDTGPNQFDEVGSAGGWIAASLGPWNDKSFNVGLAMDDVDRGDVQEGDRTFNRSLFANMFYPIYENVDWALELSHWKTDYAGSGDADSFRIQTAFIYKF